MSEGRNSAAWQCWQTEMLYLTHGGEGAYADTQKKGREEKPETEDRA